MKLLYDRPGVLHSNLEVQLQREHCSEVMITQWRLQFDTDLSLLFVTRLFNLPTPTYNCIRLISLF